MGPNYSLDAVEYIKPFTTGKNLKKSSQSYNHLDCLLYRLKSPETDSSLAHIPAPTTARQCSVLLCSASRQNVRYLKIKHHNFHIFFMWRYSPNLA